MVASDQIQHLKRWKRYKSSETKAANQSDVFTEEIKTILPNYYLEQDPTVLEWFRSLLPTRKGVLHYLQSLFPSAKWIPKYNWQWMLGDAAAGITVGFVVVPQAMAYASLAGLSPEFGLYTSFTGAAIYWLFGTSKDIVIGTTAVGSLLIGSVIASIQESSPGVYTNTEIAKVLSFMIGVVMLPIGFLRLGWIVEIIPYIPISAFVTAASITIMATQLPVLLGIADIKTREPPYRVILNTLRELERIQLDAAIGISSLVMLTLIRSICAKMEVRQPFRRRFWATLSSLRLAFVILLYMFISWLVHRNMPEHETKFRLLGMIQPGFRHAGVPRFDERLINLVLPNIPVITIILIIEHIAIAKSFGRRFNYTVNPSQEIIAQGSANLLGPFLGGYACTGSFGASAVLSKAGVRTPLAGFFSALVLVLALYALTAVFYYIPRAALAGLIIHATMNLIASPRSVYKYWKLSPFEFLIWVSGVAVAICTSLETSVYLTIGLSLAMLLVRIAHTTGQPVGQITVEQRKIEPVSASQLKPDKLRVSQANGQRRDVFLQMDRKDGSNPDVMVRRPHPGVFIYRFSPDGFNFLNQAQQLDSIAKYVKTRTRHVKDANITKPADRLWSDFDQPEAPSDVQDKLPLLRAIVFDCSSISYMDIASIEGLVDLRNNLDRHAYPFAVDWHFAGIANRWARRALVIAGFGRPSRSDQIELCDWAPVYSIASTLAGASSEDVRAEQSKKLAVMELDRESTSHSPSVSTSDVVDAIERSPLPSTTLPSDEQLSGKATPSVESLRPVCGINRPFFHVDLTEAVSAAVQNAKTQENRKKHNINA